MQQTLQVASKCKCCCYYTLAPILGYTGCYSYVFFFVLLKLAGDVMLLYSAFFFPLPSKYLIIRSQKPGGIIALLDEAWYV